MFIPLIWVTTQKKLSLAWETTMDPAPIEITNSALSISVANPRLPIIGNTMEAAVINATVDDPCASFMADAIKKGRKKLRFKSLNASPITPAIPEF